GGTLAISADSRFQADVLQAAIPLANPDQEGPWGTAAPGYFFAFRGAGPTGKLRLVPHHPRLRAQLRSEAVLTPRGATFRSHIELEGVVGKPEFADVLLPSFPGSRWHWNLEPGGLRSPERLSWREATPSLLGLGSRNAVAAA